MAVTVAVAFVVGVPVLRHSLFLAAAAVVSDVFVVVAIAVVVDAAAAVGNGGGDIGSDGGRAAVVDEVGGIVAAADLVVLSLSCSSGHPRRQSSNLSVFIQTAVLDLDSCQSRLSPGLSSRFLVVSSMAQVFQSTTGLVSRSGKPPVS